MDRQDGQDPLPWPVFVLVEADGDDPSRPSLTSGLGDVTVLLLDDYCSAKAMAGQRAEGTIPIHCCIL